MKQLRLDRLLQYTTWNFALAVNTSFGNISCLVLKVYVGAVFEEKYWSLQYRYTDNIM